MSVTSNHIEIKYGRVDTPYELGVLLRRHRRTEHITLQTMSDMSNLGMRFLSELERGKETAELGKALLAIQYLGLEIIVQPRGYNTNNRKIKE